ncbi:MAG: amino acid--tRNA ligase-related protein, partial [Nitrososphaerota archaeon]
KWFVEHFRYGAPPHGGFAIGIERLTMVILGLENIREATPFPRTPERLLP